MSLGLWLAAAGLHAVQVNGVSLQVPARADGDGPVPAVVLVGETDPARAADLAAAGYVAASVPSGDAARALQWLREHAGDYGADPGRMVLLGGSGHGSEAVRAGLANDAAAIVDLDPAPSAAEELGSDAPPFFLAAPGALASALRVRGVTCWVAGAASDEILRFLKEQVGFAPHGLPPGPEVSTPRLQTPLVDGWRFFPRDHEAGADPATDDSHWQAVTVPHTWNARDGEDGGANFHRGPAWYRRHLTIDERYRDKQLYLQFDGASLEAEVYVNGKKLGSHLGGFARFRFDATDSLQPGDNLIAVRVDNSNLGFAPLGGDFTFFGGLYRAVSLLATDRVQISTMDYGTDGIFIDQKSVSAARADLLIRAEVENYEDKKSEVEVQAVLLDAAGRSVAHAATRQRMTGGDGMSADLRISLEHPHLWDGRADPYLYTAWVTVRAKGKVRDAVAQPVGLRFFRADPDRGFFLNGHPLDLHGVNRHQDRIDRGWAIRPADEAEDFAFLGELGCTAVRSSHYQQSQTWYERCDRAGIVVWAEIPFVGPALPAPAFLANAKDQLRELIRQNYHHPSICFWSIGNETHDDPPPAPGKPSLTSHVLKALADLAKAEDGTRLSTYASDAKDADPKNWHTDVVSFNHYAGWYIGGMDEWPSYLDGVHARHPQNAFGISEYGAGASVFEHQLPALKPVPRGHFHPEEYQALFHEHVWPALAARPFVLDKFIWCLFDFASDGRNEGDAPGRNDKGLVTYDRRTRKDAYYYYQANWSDQPVVHLASRRFLQRHRPEAPVKVYSNASEVELFVNGRTAGTVRSTDRVFLWPKVALTEGENNVAAEARFGAATISDAATWLYVPGRPVSGPAPGRDSPPHGPADPASAGPKTGGPAP